MQYHASIGNFAMLIAIAGSCLSMLVSNLALQIHKINRILMLSHLHAFRQN